MAIFMKNQVIVLSRKIQKNCALSSTVKACYASNELQIC